MMHTKITKENAYEILKAFAKEFKKQNETYTPAEIIIVGGGSIMLNYNFRQATQDFDVIVQASSAFKITANIIADQYNLPNNWINTDFTKTASFSPKLREVSKHFCSFNKNSLEVRTVNGEYLIAMKMKALREYRNDESDIIGIIREMKETKTDVNYENINHAILKLYGENNGISPEIIQRVNTYVKMSIKDLENLYNSKNKEEDIINREVTDINTKYTGVVQENNIHDVIRSIKAKKEKI